MIVPSMISTPTVDEDLTKDFGLCGDDDYFVDGDDLLR